MPKRRTTGCAQQHYGPNCADCTRIRVRRFRARHRAHLKPVLPATEAQRMADNAARYVRLYLQRGAIAPPDACERCEVQTQISPSRPLRALLPWHPDPAFPKQVAWLCSECRRHLRANREPITLRWEWPGLTGQRSRKLVDLRRQIAKAVAKVDAKLPPDAAVSFRDAALVTTLMAALAPGERERLYAAGTLAGPRWRPTTDLHLDALLRAWAFEERAERSQRGRSSNGIIVTPTPKEARRSHGINVSPPKPAVLAPFDADISWAAIHLALERLNAAEALVEATNERVAALLQNQSDLASIDVGLERGDR